MNINPDLTEDQQRELRGLVYKYRDIFSSRPGRSNMWSCSIPLITGKPICAKQYPITFSLLEECEPEIQTMVDLNDVEPS